MILPLWLEWVLRTLAHYQPSRRHRKTRLLTRLRIHALEDRILPSAYLVTTTADSGPGSFRDAIAQVNIDINHAQYNSPSEPGVDEIDFAITAASDSAGGGVGYDSAIGVATITPQAALPTMSTRARWPGNHLSLIR
jgi:hypothetical protein